MKKLLVLFIILTILLGGFIVYDKVIRKEPVQEEEEEVIEEEEKYEVSVNDVIYFKPSDKDGNPNPIGIMSLDVKDGSLEVEVKLLDDEDDFRVYVNSREIGRYNYGVNATLYSIDDVLIFVEYSMGGCYFLNFAAYDTKGKKIQDLDKPANHHDVYLFGGGCYYDSGKKARETVVKDTITFSGTSNEGRGGTPCGDIEEYVFEIKYLGNYEFSGTTQVSHETYSEGDC